jgi:hypothetical protein
MQLIYRYCNNTHKNVGGLIEGTVKDYLPRLFPDITFCAGNSASRWQCYKTFYLFHCR